MKLEVRKGCFAYKNQQRVLEDISYSVSTGTLLSVLGPNGIGKTTLLKCMMGFLKWNSGATLIDGTDIKELSSPEIWRKIAYVPQAKGSAFSFTGLEMAIMGRSAHLGVFSLPGKNDIAIAEAVMDEIGILHLRNKPCNQMSGGELQMVLIARALTTRPQLLVLDEPESGLDFRNQLMILDLLDRLVHNGQICAVINTHYPSHAFKISDATILIGRNLGYRYGPTKDIITVDNMRTLFGVDVAIEELSLDGEPYTSIVPIRISSIHPDFSGREFPYSVAQNNE